MAKIIGSNSYQLILPQDIYTQPVDDIIYSEEFTNTRFRGAKFFVNIVTVNAGSLAFNLEGKDPISGAWQQQLIVGDQLNSPGLQVYGLYPGFSDLSALYVNDILPLYWRAGIIMYDSADIEFSVGAVLYN